MPFFSGLDDNSAAPDILKMNPAAGKALAGYIRAVVEQPSPLSRGERELIAAYVSGLNACTYCFGVHSLTAAHFGLEEEAIEAMLDDLDTAPMDEKMKPMLRLAGKLTQEPAKTVQADIDAILAAGWDEQAVHDAINVCCLFNFMNRLMDGHGVKGGAPLHRARADILLKAHGDVPAGS